MKEIHTLLHTLYKRGGSDLHLAEGYRPRLRLHGDLVDLDEYPVLTRSKLYEHMQQLISERRFKDFLGRGDLDFAWDWEGVARFRCNYLIAQHGLGAVFRLVPEAVVPFDQLQMPKPLLKFVQQRSGLVLMTGPTGSGKSTTLAALLDHINATRADYIVTVEDPIEFVHRNKKSFITQREVGSHTRTFASALRACLKEKVDVLLVGEVREHETMSLALQAAEMGFLVLATLHTGSVITGLGRILDMFPPPQRPAVRQKMANTLVGMSSQTLIKRASGQGRLAACEVLVANSYMRSLLREGLIHQIPSVFQQGASLGCQTMDTSIADLVKRRLVDRQEALIRMMDRSLLEG